MNKTSLLFLTAGALGVLPTLASAQTDVNITFNDVAPGSQINTAYQSQYNLTFVADDTLNPAVYADNPGLPASPVASDNALVGIFSRTFLYLGPGSYANGFQFDVVPDPAGFGSTSAPVEFFDTAFNSLGLLTIDETVAGTYSVPFQGIQAVILPADVYFDNLRTQAVPEPGALAILGAGGLALTLLQRRKRR